MNQQKPLIDITNDSPIVGLASGPLSGLETPSSAISSKQRSLIRACKNNNTNSTPGTGEALLRGQVKTLLQKVEEEAGLSKMMIPPFKRLQGFFSCSSSPMGLLLAPTPANTPQVSDLAGGDVSGFTSVAPSPVVEQQQLKISRVMSDVFDGKKEEMVEGRTIESQKSLNRSLLLDFCEKSEASSEDCYYKGKPTAVMDDGNSSVWSVQVNASAKDEEELEEEEEEQEENCHHGNYQDDDDFEGGGEEEKEKEKLMMDEVCEAVRKISVNDHNFIGKHTRFVYDSDDEEIVEAGVVEGGEDNGVLHLKGLSTPKGGNHIRFPVDEED